MLELKLILVNKMGNSILFTCKRSISKQSKFFDVENTTALMGLTFDLQECDTFQFIVLKTGSGGIDILFVKVYTQDANRHARATATISTVNSC